MEAHTITDKCSVSTPIIGKRMAFWKPGGDNTSLIDHVDVPIHLDSGFEVSVGKRGVNWLADPKLWRQLDVKAGPWATGTVDTQFALPNSTGQGWATKTTALHSNFNAGVLPNEFAILHQKGSIPENIDVVSDTVDGTRKNVVRIKAVAQNGTVKSAGLLQTTGGLTPCDGPIPDACCPSLAFLQTSMVRADMRSKHGSPPSRVSSLPFGASITSITLM